MWKKILVEKVLYIFPFKYFISVDLKLRAENSKETFKIYIGSLGSMYTPQERVGPISFYRSNFEYMYEHHTFQLYFTLERIS